MRGWDHPLSIRIAGPIHVPLYAPATSYSSHFTDTIQDILWPLRFSKIGPKKLFLSTHCHLNRRHLLTCDEIVPTRASVRNLTSKIPIGIEHDTVSTG